MPTQTPVSYNIPKGLLCLFTTMLSVQFGSAQAKILLSEVGPQTGVVLRLLTGAILLFLFLRPWRSFPSAEQWKAVAAYGISVAVMNASFYQAIARMPIGIVVSIELSGPLLVAAFTSRRRQDFISILFAATGIFLLLPFEETKGVTWPGIFWAVMAALSWAAYIVFGTSTSRSIANKDSAVSWGILTGAIVTLPLLSMSETPLTTVFTSVPILARAFLVGFTATAFSFWLEMFTMRLLPTSMFSVLLSLNPVLASLFGALLLDEWITPRQCLAIGCILVASVLISIRRR